MDKTDQKPIKSYSRSIKIGIPIFVCVVVLTSLGLVLARNYVSLEANVALVSDYQPVDKPVAIELNQKIRTIDTESIKIEPAIKGSWQFDSSSFLDQSNLVFTPSDDFIASTTYQISMPAAKRAIVGQTDPLAVSFTTEAAPGILPSGLTKLTKNQTIASDHIFNVELAAKNHTLRKLELETTPKIEFNSANADDTSYSWQPKKLLPQGKTLKVTLKDTKNKQTLFTQTVKVAKTPKLTSPLNQSHINKNQTIELKFSESINQKQAQIKFAIAGSGKWTSAKTYQFSPTKVAPDKTYAYTIAKGLRSVDGGILNKKIKGSFSTIGAAYVVASSPSGSQLSRKQQTITFRFDQPINSASAKSKFSINRGKIKSISVSGHTLRAIVTDFGYQKSVRATMKSGVKNSGFGLPSNRSYTVSFSTEVRSRKLAVPYYHQQHSATCAVASLRMALAYKGVKTSEKSIVNKMGYNPTKLDKKKNIWDNPREMFVGSIDGSLAKGTGAGPDADPVAKAARAYGRSATLVHGASPSWIAQQIYKKRPVIMFGAMASGVGFYKWKTSDGTKVKMNKASHATVVVGVQGEPSSPIGFWVNDPLSGSTQFWSTAQVRANIAQDAYGQAVAIH